MSGLRGLNLLALLLCMNACAKDDGGGDAGEGGSAGQASGGASGAASGGSSGADASGGTSGASASGGSGGASGGVGGAGGASISGGMGGSDAMEDAATGNVGVCGQRGMATVSTTTFTGYEELYVIADEGFGDDICVVRFEVTRIDEAAPEGCDDPTADVDCLWTHTVELSNPMVMTDVDGACAGSSLGLDAEAIAALDGTRASYGFVSEFAGHNSVVLRYDEAMGEWSPFGNGTWDEEGENFRFDHRDGLCDY